MLIKHVAHLAAVTVLEEEVGIVDTLIIAGPVGLERIVVGSVYTDGHAADGVRLGGADGVIGKAVHVGSFVVVVVGGYPLITLAN